MGWEEVVKCWGLPWQKQARSVSLEGFASGVWAAPLLPPALPSRHQEGVGQLDSQPLPQRGCAGGGEGEQARQLKMCAHGAGGWGGHMSREGHWGAWQMGWWALWGFKESGHVCLII